MKKLIFILLLIAGLTPSVWGQYTAAVRFGTGEPTYTPSLVKKESKLYFDYTNNDLYQHDGAKWEIRSIRYSSGTPANTIAKNVKFVIDTSGATPLVYLRKNNVFQLMTTGGGAGGAFPSDIIINIANGKTFGKYANGQTVSASGKTAIQVITEALSEAVPPTYTSPTIVLNTPPTNNFEIGSAINNTLTSTFTQNNAGALSSTQYKKDGVNITSPDAIASLTTQVCYSVVASYAQGACLNNNLGAQDCTGRIAAGSITSATNCLTPLSNKYYGFTASNTPTDANIRALSQVLSASLGTLSTTFGAQSNTFLVYAYPATFADLTSFNINGFESLSSFTKTTRAFVNAQGFSQSYKIYISNNAFTTSGNTVIVAQ